MTIQNENLAVRLRCLELALEQGGDSDAVDRAEKYAAFVSGEFIAAIERPQDILDKS